MPPLCSLDTRKCACFCVFEMSALGIKGCTTLQVRKPAASVDVAEPITELDLYVGAVITIHQRTFELLEADEFTMQASSARH